MCKQQKNLIKKLKSENLNLLKKRNEFIKKYQKIELRRNLLTDFLKLILTLDTFFLPKIVIDMSEIKTFKEILEKILSWSTPFKIVVSIFLLFSILVCLFNHLYSVALIYIKEKQIDIDTQIEINNIEIESLKEEIKQLENIKQKPNIFSKIFKNQ